jgi:uncharacterized membrane protein
MTEKEIPNNSQFQLKVLSGDKLPPPDVLREYERLMPGVTKLLIEKAIQHQQTRSESERRALNSNGIYLRASVKKKRKS